MKFLKISLSTKGEVRQDKRMNNYNIPFNKYILFF